MRIGGILQACDRLGRDLAQYFRPARTGLAMPDGCGSLTMVVAARSRRAGTGSLNRYPSPDGRRAFPPCTPPIFSSFGSTALRDQRSFAQTEKNCGSAFLGTKRVSVWLTKEFYTEEGSTTCGLPNGSPARYARLHLPLAATRRWNRACWVRVPARGRQSCLTETRSPARSSAARQTCFTVSAIRDAADPVASPRKRHLNTSAQSHRTLRPGGFLLSDAALSASSSTGHGPGCQEQEGT